MAWLTNEHLKNKAPKGDTLVWLTSLGLTFGLTMIVVLLCLIMYKGVQVFWPNRVVEFQLPAEQGASLPGGQPKLAGQIMQRVEKNMQVADEDLAFEYQLYTGNKDAMGQGFRYVDAKDVLGREYPKDLMVVERLEYGNAIIYPIAITRPDGGRIEAGQPEFQDSLHKLVKEYEKRRHDILRIEKNKIGAVNRRIRKQEIEIKKVEGNKGLSATEKEARIQEIRGKLDTLQEEYQLLAQEAGALRALQNADKLEYRISTGQERSMHVGHIVSLYMPNQLGFFQRVGIFFSRLWGFLSEDPREANTEGGIFPAIFGTFVMTLLMSMAVTPFGVVAAIYLREYARQGMLVKIVRICVNNLAGVPSIVFGVFGLAFFVYILGGWIDQTFYSESLPTATFGTGGIMWASLTLALLTLPVVIVATEEALAAVPRGVREAALACGASKWQTIQRVVLPSAAPGVLTGLILAMARGAGEVAPLMLVGVVKLSPSLPLDSTAPFIHAERKFMHLGFHIYDLAFQSPDSEAARPILYATTFLLILLIVVLNLGAILIRDRLRKKYAAGTF